MSDEDVPSVDDSDMAVPFVVVASNGGPYEDDAYVAGFEAGRFEAEMGLCRLVGTKPCARWVHRANLAQIDLAAMRHRFTLRILDDRTDDDDDDDDLWVWVTVV